MSKVWLYIWPINEQRHAMITKVATHQVAGTYKPTTVDSAKASVDFLIVDASGVIDWKDGRRQFCNKRELKALKAAYTWMTNF